MFFPLAAKTPDSSLGKVQNSKTLCEIEYYLGVTTGTVIIRASHVVPVVSTRSITVSTNHSSTVLYPLHSVSDYD